MDVKQIIHLALKQLGVLATGERATADDVADGVACLRMLLGQWATDKLYIFQIKPLKIVLDGTKQQVNGVQKIADIALLNGQEITLIRDSDLHFFPKSHGVIYGEYHQGFWVQGSGELTINGYVLPVEIDVDDELDVPITYERALILSLALELAPMYGVEPSQLLLRNQAQAVAMLKRANSTPFWASNDLPIGICGCGL